jgi:hypothetical protein
VGVEAFGIAQWAHIKEEAPAIRHDVESCFDDQDLLTLRAIICACRAGMVPVGKSAASAVPTPTRSTA